MQKKIFPILLICMGVAIDGISIFANQLGIHTGSHWGLGRKLLLSSGMIFLFIGLIFQFYPWVNKTIHQAFLYTIRQQFWLDARNRIKPAYTRLVVLKNGYIISPFSKFSLWWSRTWVYRFTRASGQKLAIIFALPIIIIVIAVYIWIVSVGRWSSWPNTTSYYDQLATSFTSGHTYLLETPNPRLAMLADPYDFNQRKSISGVPWDVSYYKGHYYLYWGPTPALLLSFVKLILPVHVFDDVLVFIFTAGVFLILTYLIFLIWRSYFRNLPWWVTSLALLMAGLINPMPWLLSRPEIYEAAIASGQFFLLAGLATMVTVFLIKPGVKNSYICLMIVLGGFLWVLAIGSRVTLAVPIMFLAILFSWLLYRYFEKYWQFLMSLWTTLLVGFGLLAGYNLARFDSLIEFGHRYQLTGMDQNLNYSAVVSLANLPPNIYNYLFNPFRTLPVFPFIKPQLGGHYLFYYIQAPKLYYSEQVVGILPSAPFVLYAIFTFVYWLRHLPDLMTNWRVQSIRPNDREYLSPNAIWLASGLTGGTILAIFPLFFFLVCSMRYSADFVPLLTLTAVVGYWQGINALVKRPWLSWAWKLTGACLTILTVVYGVLLGVTGYASRFEIMNPVLFDHITRFFAR